MSKASWESIRSDYDIKQRLNVTEVPYRIWFEPFVQCTAFTVSLSEDQDNELLQIEENMKMCFYDTQRIFI